VNINVVTVVTFAAGLTLLYAGITGKDPRSVLQTSLAGKSPKTAETFTPPTPVTPPDPKAGRVVSP
jgi:hypothetical protein